MGDDANGGEGSRLDRELNELLQELRVALPGVQVLFAFLLSGLARCGPGYPARGRSLGRQVRGAQVGSAT